MDPLSAAASVIAVLQLSAKVLSYLNDVKDSSQGRMQCAIEASNLHNLLTNLRFRLEEGHGREPWFNAVQALAVENGPLDQFRQALETLQAKMTDVSRLRKVGEALVWKFKKEEIDVILTRMERLKTLVEIALQMDHFKLSQAIQDDTHSIRTSVSGIESAVHNVQQVQVTAAQRTIIEWLSPSDYPAQQSDIIKRRQKGTGQWFLDAPEVAKWLNDPKTNLFCPGIPGAGKTMLAAVAINELLEATPNGSHCVAYVYCNYKSRADQDIVSILAAILKQLVQNQPSMLEPVEALHKKHDGCGTKPSLDEIYDALQAVLALYSHVHIVVDALDECHTETRRQLCLKLLDLQKDADMRLMVTSRFVPDVEDVFREALKIEVEASDEDVKQFVIGQMDRLPGCVQRNVELQELVQERVVEAVGGMFLLARLHIDTLSGTTRAKEVKSTLATLSRGAAALDDAYSEALERIEGQRAGHSRLAKNVLAWITFAKRPLTTAELCCALAVEPGEDELDPDNKPDVDDIVSVCAGLVVVDQKSGIIRLVHYTTQEYFERISSRLSPDGELGLAETCLTYLSFRDFESGGCTSYEGFEERLHQHELFDYAARYCGQHARAVEAKVAHLVCTLLSHGGAFSSVAQALSLSGHGMEETGVLSPTTTALHWIAQFGLAIVAKEFLSTVKEERVRAVNARDSLGRGPLMLTAIYGHHEVAELLLDSGADVNAQGGYYSYPLLAAANAGHVAVVRRLLDHGADANAQHRILENASQAAALHGYETMVGLLLDNGADFNAHGISGYFRAIRAASYNGNKAVVRLLREKGAGIYAQSGRYNDILQAAAYTGERNMVECLIESASTRQLLDTYDRTLLWWAAAGGQNDIVQMLIIQYSYDPRAPDKFGRTPLWIAMKKGHDKVSTFLRQFEPPGTERGPLIEHTDAPPAMIECDVCTSHIRDAEIYYHCPRCFGGHWDMCDDCKMRGASCLDDTHILVNHTTEE